MTEGTSSHRVRVWDLPIRLFHWLLAAGVVAMFATAWSGAVEWHARIGYAIGTLLLFRLAWGFAGGHWARFASFPPSPAAAWRFLRSTAVGNPGHNPLGALSVYGMLLLLVLQVGSGLFTETKEDFAGPLTTLASNATVHWLTGYHKRVGQWIVLVLVGLHLLAVALYFWRGRNLIRPMLTGDADAPPHTLASRDDASIRLRALALLLVSALAMWGVVSLGG